MVGKNCGQLAVKFPDCQEFGIRTIENFAKSGGDVFSLPSTELIELYCAADIFVLPTLIETFGMVLIEAMAAGLPIVTTDAPGVRDVIDHGINGLKAPVGNPGAVADTVCSLIEDPGMSGRLSENSIRQAKECYDWETVTGKYIVLYEEILKGHC